VIVNQTFAHRYFGNRAPIGQVISQNNERMEIVGVVGDAKYMEIREAMGPTVYENAFQRANVPSQLLIRTGRDPETIAASVRAEVMSMMGNVLIRERTLEDHIGASIVRERLVATLAAFFGGLALLLGAIGLYGVVSNSVAARTREIGIRIALGIEPRRVVCMVLRDVLTLVGGGIVLGLPLAMLLTRFIASLLYGLAPDDPLTMLISVCSLLSAALLAAFVPARRASRVDPMIALRNE
jgi:predicted lysophospholipase L1 biosynthesis ABC-type transport system permease subunit